MAVKKIVLTIIYLMMQPKANSLLCKSFIQIYVRPDRRYIYCEHSYSTQAAQKKNFKNFSSSIDR